MLLDDYFAKLASQEKEIKKETEKETKKKPYFSAPAKPASKPEKELTRKQVNSVNWLNDLKKCRLQPFDAKTEAMIVRLTLKFPKRQ